MRLPLPCRSLRRAASARVQTACFNEIWPRRTTDPTGRMVRSVDALVIDVGAVRRVEIGDQQLIVGESDDAMFARHAPVREDDISGRGAADADAGGIDDEQVGLKLALLDLETVDFLFAVLFHL